MEVRGCRVAVDRRTARFIPQCFYLLLQSLNFLIFGRELVVDFSHLVPELLALFVHFNVLLNVRLGPHLLLFQLVDRALQCMGLLVVNRFMSGFG